MQTGMDRYINIKEKINPQDTKMGNVGKINRASSSQGTVQNSNTANSFELLADTSHEIHSEVLDTDKKKARLPSLYIRQKNSKIYNIQFLLDRRITVEEPHKRNGPVQCANCQEYGHTKSYCTLRSVFVACGELHTSPKCELKNAPNSKKCSNCEGDHTANYRGCPVYKELKNRINQRVSTTRSHHTPLIPSKSTPEVFFSSATRSSLGSSTINKSKFCKRYKSGPCEPCAQCPTTTYSLLPAYRTLRK